MKRLRKLSASALFRDTAPWVPILLLTALVAAAAAITMQDPGAVSADAKNDNSSVYYSSNSTASQESSTAEAINSRIVQNYTVRIRDDRIVICENSSGTAVYAIGTPPSRLPGSDRLLLEHGLHAETLEEAYRLIEDYE